MKKKPSETCGSLATTVKKAGAFIDKDWVAITLLSLERVVGRSWYELKGTNSPKRPRCQ